MDSSVSGKDDDILMNSLTRKSDEISLEAERDAMMVSPVNLYKAEESNTRSDNSPALDLTTTRPNASRPSLAEGYFVQNLPPSTSAQSMEFQEGEEVYCTHVGRRKRLTSVKFCPLDASDGRPIQFKLKQTFRHGSDVSAVAINSRRNQVYTGSRNCVKIWNINQSSEVASPVCMFNCKQENIRCMKISTDCTILIIGGDSNKVNVWSLCSRYPQFMEELDFRTGTCNDLAISSCTRFCYVACSNGLIYKWDLLYQKLLRKYSGHKADVTCVDISGIDEILWSGSLDKSVRSWDIRQGEPFKTLYFSSQISSLSVKSFSPYTCWLAVGLTNSDIEILNGKLYAPTTDKFQLSLHKSGVSSVRFSNSGEWFVSTGKDASINAWKTPCGPILFQLQEPSGPRAEILCSDISEGDRYLVTGIKNMKARVYEILHTTRTNVEF